MEYDHVTPDWLKLVPDFLLDYPDAKEEDNCNSFHLLIGKALDTTILVDTDHSHDKKTGVIFYDRWKHRLLPSFPSSILAISSPTF